MPDTERRIERAEKALLKGKPDLALAEYLAAIEEEPTNEGVYHTAADICVSLGRNSEAVQLLSDLFERQCSRADKTRAALTYKKLSRVTRPTGEQSLIFANSLAKNNEEALKAYEAAFHVFTNKGRTREALAALNGIVALAPSIENFRKQAELAAELNLIPEAAAAYLAAGELEKDEDSKFIFLERAYKLQPQDSRIAMTYAQALLDRGNAERAAIVTEPFTSQGESQQDARAIYGRATLAAKQPARAIRFLWELMEREPSNRDLVIDAITALAMSDQPAAAVEWLHKLEGHEEEAGRRREFLSLLKTVGSKNSPGIELLEYMVDVFNRANREHDYCDTLLKLFDLYYAAGNYARATTCLDRAAEVDAYEPGHASRLDMLKGKVDSEQLKSVAVRLSVTAPAEIQVQAEQDTTPDGEDTVLDDLITQAQIYFRYSMDSKAVEKLRRVQKVFPGEEQNNAELYELYARAGILPRHADTPPDLVEQPRKTVTASSAETSVNDLGRITEITKNLYRQVTVKNVLFSCVNDAGRHWKASRCLAVLCTPGKPPSIAVEYCAPGVQKSDIRSIVKLIGLTQPLTVAHGTLNLSNAKTIKSPLKPLRKAVAGMGMQSLLAVPLISGEENVGLLTLAQCDAAREWSAEDVGVLNAIAEQVTLAVSNVRLRKLVRDLAVTEDSSGLVRRSCYTDVLLSEITRALKHNLPTSLMLLHIDGQEQDSKLEKSDLLMRSIASLVTSHIRQNDVAFRYDSDTIALILTGTDGTNATRAAEKLIKVAAVTPVPGAQDPISVTVGVVEAILEPEYDPADIATEAVNRADRSLAQALAANDDRIVFLPAPVF